MNTNYLFYLENGSLIEFFDLVHEMGEFELNDCYNSFEKGKKVAGKLKHKEKYVEGAREIQRIIYNSRSNDSEISETAYDGLSSFEKLIVIDLKDTWSK